MTFYIRPQPGVDFKDERDGSLVIIPFYDYCRYPVDDWESGNRNYSFPGDVRPRNWMMVLQPTWTKQTMRWVKELP